jgi:hypothetical protein
LFYRELHFELTKCKIGKELSEFSRGEHRKTQVADPDSAAGFKTPADELRETL